MITNQNENETSSNFDLKKAVYSYLTQWKWFVLSCAICLGVAYAMLRYTTPKYAAVAKIMLLTESDGASAAGEAFSDLSIFSDREEAKVDDEIQVIKSRSFLRSIVKKLGLNVQFFTKGRIYETELYKHEVPIDVNFIASDSIINKTNFSFNIEVLSNTAFNYRINEDDSPKKIAFGKQIQTYFGGIVITPKHIKKGENIRVSITSMEYLAESLKFRINVSPTNKSSKVLNISIKDSKIEKAKDILNALIEEYNRSTIEKKTVKSKNTADFIDQRIALITKDLISVDDSIVHFKTGHKVTDISSEAGQYLNASAINEQQLDASRIQLNQLNYMKESLGDENSSFTPIPSNLGMGDPAISSLSVNYNELVAKRERLLKNAGAKNPTVLELEKTISNVRQNLGKSVANATNSLNITISGLQGQSSRLNSKIRSIPGQTSELTAIERKQGIKEQLYLYLLEKSEETKISSIATASSPGAKIIDEAYNSNGGPVSPNKRITYIAALFIGLLIPFLIIYITDLLDTKVHNKEDLENEIKNITVLGEVPRVNEKDSLIKYNDQSILSESFRIIRTNFEHIKRSQNIEDYNNVVFVTSTINGEGKSFFSVNMALTLSNTNKKVLLIGADIRNPQIFSAIKQKNQKLESKLGLTEYIADESVSIKDTIKEHEINNIKIDILLSGKIPPNPAELLMNDRVKDLFDYVSSEYDYVIVDTAPSMLVTDTLLISKYAGHTIYLTRAEYTEKRILNFTKELHTNNKLNGMMLVINDVKQSNFGYGAKYGYYGAPQKKGLFKRKAAV